MTLVLIFGVGGFCGFIVALVVVIVHHGVDVSNY